MGAVASNRMFLTRALKRQLPKSEVYEAEDGRQAVLMVTADLAKYHVVCMDKEMPVCNAVPCIVLMPAIVPVICLIVCWVAWVQVLDGYGATRELRKAGYHGVIIGVTANALSSDVQAYIAQGVNGVVTKPVDVPGLLDVIEQHISLPSTVPLASAAAAQLTRSRHGSATSWASDHRSTHADVSPNP
jgi:CheY-like chemotaxis protein